jgi:putative membrane protein
MPSANPLFYGRWSLHKFQATVLNDIWPETLFFTLIALMVTLVNEYTTTRLFFAPQLLTVLGTVLGLVISFRTTTAYERYQEGRKLWTGLITISRNIAQMIWLHVPVERQAKPGQPETTVLQNTIEKKTMVNLTYALSVAIKHHLRSEPGIYYRDLYPLVCVLPRYVNATPPHDIEDLLPLWHASEHHGHHHPDPVVHNFRADRNPREAGDSEKVHRTSSLPGDLQHNGTHSDLENGNGTTGRNRKSKKLFDPESALADTPSPHELKPGHNPPDSSIFDYVPVFRVFKWIARRAGFAPKKERRPPPIESNVPLEILLELSAYSGYLAKNGLLSPAIAANYGMSLTALQDVCSNLARIRSTPIPFAYQAHLRMSLWIYLFFLPFQIVQSVGWVTIPGTAFSAFLLSGFLEIGQEIENPFNYDHNDLDLDQFCLALQREMHQITARTIHEPHQFMFNAWNQPFAPSDRRTAEQLCADGATTYTPPSAKEEGSYDSKSLGESVQLTMLRNWRQVDEITRQPY